MAVNSKKISELAVSNTVLQTERLVVLKDPSGTPSVKTVAFSDIGSSLEISNSAPASSVAAGESGMLRYDNDFLYVCIATNVWKKVALTTW